MLDTTTEKYQILLAIYRTPKEIRDVLSRVPYMKMSGANNLLQRPIDNCLGTIQKYDVVFPIISGSSFRNLISSSSEYFEHDGEISPRTLMSNTRIYLKSNYEGRWDIFTDFGYPGIMGRIRLNDEEIDKIEMSMVFHKLSSSGYDIKEVMQECIENNIRIEDK